MDYKVPGTPYALVKFYFLPLPTLYAHAAITSATPKIAIYAAMSTSGRTNSLMRNLPSLPKSCQKPLLRFASRGLQQNRAPAKNRC